ncbi:hypothetical protein LXH13_20050 [Streptomyces spinosirectus]|jgi:hypothetical protein|uniref:SCO2400 family protein n=1 Tax=Streptomyces TaxID=1883 RepID=UPI001C9DBB50|nr:MULTISPECIES: hypothetical protein [Streptomyces]MBY8343002.1 hypothetical protein [Streptomyces plumbidurans]UIR19200.1 hypothetical protein LXH13_20050 [Streptomyces spinosirectus]
MDYCSSCRRHLNGALVCPGCGAYAPDIAPVTRDGHGFEPFAPKTPPRHEPRPFDPAPHEEIPAAEAALPTGEGRAARRRQRARWKKNQRRAVVATTVALVGGGLTISTMGSGSDHRDQASAAPDFTSTGAQDLPAQPYAEPTTPAPGTGKHRKPQSSDGTTASGNARHGAATAPDAPSTASASTRPYSAPHTSRSAVRQQTAAAPSTGTSSGDTGTSTPSRSPSATAGDTSTSGSSNSGASQSSSSQSGSSQSGSSQSPSGTSTSPSGTSTSPSGDTATTSPSGICVLGLLCLG